MIKEYRIKLKLTQEELAEKVNLSPRQLQRIEKDEGKTKLSTLIKLIKELNISDTDILNFLKK